MRMRIREGDDFGIYVATYLRRSIPTADSRIFWGEPDTPLSSRVFISRLEIKRLIMKPRKGRRRLRDSGVIGNLSSVEVRVQKWFTKRVDLPAFRKF